MPTYDYECKNCGSVEEHFHSISEEPEILCGKCGKETIKLISAGSGLIFKGSGFYITDYKNKSTSGKPTKSPEKDKKESSGKGKTSTKSEKKDKKSPDK